jgi:hypothetical protein
VFSIGISENTKEYKEYKRHYQFCCPSLQKQR